MRHVVIGVGALVAALAVSAAPNPSVDTRTFSGTGSLGTDSHVELYLLDGTYHHRLVSTTGCYVNAGLYPSISRDGVLLADIIRTDLLAGRSPADPARSLVISQPGWATLQVGTGRDCEWTYSITGSFLPEGEEPVPAAERGGSWLLVAGIVVLASALGLALRPRRQPAEEEEREKVRVVTESD